MDVLVDTIDALNDTLGDTIDALGAGYNFASFNAT